MLMTFVRQYMSSAIYVPQIFLQLGFDSLFFARIDYQDRAKRLMGKNLEVVWQGSKSLGSTSQVRALIFVVLLPFWPFYLRIEIYFYLLITTCLMEVEKFSFCEISFLLLTICIGTCIYRSLLVYFLSIMTLLIVSRLK